MDAKTPVCPVCGAKFAHDNQTASCKNCGVSDLILGMPDALAQWKAGKWHSKPTVEFKRRGSVASRTRKRRAHGRTR